ncbi:MAG: DUF3568 family protein [Phycisphaeraceae bacterium]
MTNLLRLFSLTLLVTLAAGQLGCATTAGARGTAMDNINAGPREIIAAAETVLEAEGVHIISSEADSLHGSLRGRTGEDELVRVEVERTTDEGSEMSLSLGRWGNHARASELSRRIATTAEHDRVEDVD